MKWVRVVAVERSIRRAGERALHMLHVAGLSSYCLFGHDRCVDTAAGCWSGFCCYANTHPLHRVLDSPSYPHMLGMTNKYVVVPKSPQAICYFSIFPHQSTTKISFVSELCPDPRKGASGGGAARLLACFGDCDWVVDGWRLQWFLFVQLPSSVNKYANWNLRIVYKLIGFCCFRQTNFLLHRFTSQPAST